MKISQACGRVIPLIVGCALSLSASAIECVSPGNADDAAAINAAIGRAAEGDGKVQLEDGTYLLSAPVVVNTAVELIGNDVDRTAVVLDAQASSKSSGDWRVIYTMSDAALVHGVTVTHGRNNTSESYEGVDANFAGSAFTAGGVFSNCLFVANQGNYCAVGISGNGVITDSEVRECQVTNGYGPGAGHGGGVKVGGNGILRRTLVTDCHASYGGGVALKATTALVEDCVISNNYSSSASAGGGAMVVSGTMRNCLVCDNTKNNCGGIYLSGWLGVVEGCLITRNTASTGGGVNIDDGTLRHCTVVGNAATASAPGVSQKNGTVESCIIWNNGSGTYLQPELSYVREGGTCTYTCAQQAPVGNGNINDRLPVFADASNGDWSLTAASPCRGAGKNGTDMGAIPYVESSAPRVSFTYVLADGGAPASTTFTATLEGDCGEATGYSWTFGDGTSVDTTSGAEAYHEYAAAGRYTVTLTVTTEKAGVLCCTVENAVNLGSNEIWVDSKAGEGKFPYATPDTASSDISKAFAAMLIGEGQRGKLHLADGTYPIATPIAVNGPVEVVGNDADRSKVVLDGGGKNRILYTKSATAFVHGITFANGNASDGANCDGVEAHYAGAVFTAGGVISNCTFRTVKGNWSSVGISGNGVITDCEVLDGEVSNGYGPGAGNGGGVKMNGGVLRRTLVSHCFAQYGGGLRVNGGLVDSCVISNCASSTGMGGGIYQKGGVVSNSVIVCNGDDLVRRTTSARGVYMESGTMVGCLITGNRGVTGGGVYKTNGALRNCTVSGNVGTTANGGVLQTGGAIENCIIVSNGKSGKDDDSLGVSGGTVTYTCALPKPAGEGNIDADPIFANAEAGDFRLNGASPCIDVGLNGLWNAEGLDLAGTPRILVGKPDGTETIDLGCYEYDLSKAPPSCAFEVIGEWTTTKPPLEVTFRASTQGGVGTVNGYIWNFGDGKSETTTEPTVKHGFTDFGNYTVSLTLDCTGGVVVPFERKSVVSIRPTVVYVSCSGSGTEPYDTPQKATSSLVDAIAAVAVPDEGLGVVHVAPGTYVRQNADPILVTKAIRVVGDGGPDVTTVSVGKETILSDLDAVITVSDENAVIEGLSFSGANKAVRLLSLSLGTVRNCAFAETKSRKSPVDIAGGTLDNCVIRNSEASTYGGTTGFADGGFFINAGVMQNCVVSNCYGSSAGAGSLEGGTVSNCLFIANRHGGSYGGGVSESGIVRVAGGVMANCIVSNNYTETSLKGVVGVYASAGTVRSCLVSDNRGVGSVGLWASGSAVVENVTVAGNVSTGEGVTTGVKASPKATLVNVLAWGDGAAAVNAIDNGATCTTCLFDKDPIFRNAERGDYRIKNGSPAQNAGTNRDWMQGAVDLFGNARILNKRVDIGCHENVQSGLILIFR